MKKVFFLVCALIIAAYLAVTAFAGYSISREIAVLKENLSLIDGFEINNFQYEKGFFGGKLYYDVIYNPFIYEKSDQFQKSFLQEAGDPIHFSGTVDVKHGPYVGGGSGFALAMTETSWDLKEKFQDFFPEYSTYKHLVLESVTTIGFNGSITTIFTGPDYNGPVETGTDIPELEVALLLEDWRCIVKTTSRLEAIDISVYVGEIFFNIEENGTIYGSGFSEGYLNIDYTKMTDLLWGGEFIFAIGRIDLIGEDETIVLDDTVVLFKNDFKEDTFDSIFEISTENIGVGNGAIKGFKLAFSIRNMDIAAVETYMHILERNFKYPGQNIDEKEMDDIINAFKQLFAAEPSFNIDELSCHVVEPKDIHGHLKLYYSAEAPIDIDMPEKMLAHIGVDAGIFASSKALEKLARIHAELESIKYETVYGRPMPEQKIESLAQELMMQIMRTFTLMPFFAVSEEGVRSRLEIKNGMIFANGQKVMYTKDFLGLLN